MISELHLARRTDNMGLELGEFLRVEMLNHGLKSARALAKYAGVSHDSVSRALHGGRPEPETIQKLAAKLKADTDYMMALAGYVALPTRRRDAVLVPFVENAYLSAGPGASVDPIGYVPQASERTHAFRAVPVVGDCMEPEIHQGDIVIVNLTLEAAPGDIVAAQADGDYIVKRLERKNGRLWLVANRDREPIPVNEDVKILGIVKFSGRPH